MKKTLYIIVLTLCFVLALIGKSYGQGWEKEFIDLNPNYKIACKLIMPTADGGIIYAYAFSYPQNRSIYSLDSLLIERDDRFGNLVWQKRIASFEISNDFSNQCGLYIRDIIQYNESIFYLIIARPDNCGERYHYYKMNTSGDFLDKNVIEYNSPSYNNGVIISTNEILSLDSNRNILITNCTSVDSGYFQISTFTYNDSFKNIEKKIIRSKFRIINNNIIQSIASVNFFYDDYNKRYAFIHIPKAITLGWPYPFDSSEIYKFDLLTGDLVYKRKMSYNTYKSLNQDQSRFLKPSFKFINNDGKLYFFCKPEHNNRYSSYDTTIMFVLDNNLGSVIYNDIIISDYYQFYISNYIPLNDSLFVFYGKFIKNIVDSIQYNLCILNVSTHTINFISDSSFGSKNLVNAGSLDLVDFIKLDKYHLYISSYTNSGLIRTSENIFFSQHILSGSVYIDNNTNCIRNSLEQGIANHTIVVTKNNQSYFCTSDKSGNYEIGIPDTGNFVLTIRENTIYNLWSSSFCGSTKNLFVRDTVTYDTANFGLKPTILCPINTVNVSSPPPFRIGQSQTYYVNYCNNGTILSTNTYITIKLDSLLDFNSSTIPYTTLANHTYRFNIGNLDYLTCGDFSFVATPRVGAVQLNQTLCTEAHIYPDTVCTTPNYTGSYIVASAQCLGDSVELKLENRGGDMQSRKRYIVIEDQVMRIDNTYQLPRNGTLIEKMPADSGKTYRIIAEQEDNLPSTYGDKFATAAIEACRPNSRDNFSTGYFTQFPNYDGEPFRAMSCNIITGAYDPNDKVASPVGYAAQHYIEKNTQIDYQINFQNTGNDTAFKVVVVDTIAPILDINTIQLGVASHAYQFQRTDSNVVQFVFDNIFLVDSFRNEALSHGFVKFKIQQKLNNPNGTKIYNKADIYFDYNAPIVTNQTYHTVGQNFITVKLISSVKNPIYNVKEVKVFPNPFREKTQIIVEAERLKNPVLLLMNIEGKIIKTISSTNNNTFDIYREDLNNGMYLFKIMQGDDEVANGKVLAQ